MMHFRSIYRLFILASIAFCITAFVSAQKTINLSIVRKGAALEKLAGGFSFTEGPAADSEGNVCFTDQPNNRIMKWDINGKLSTFLKPSGRSNGMYFDKAGSLWTCADEKNELWRISRDKNIDSIVLEYNNHRLNGPNDLWISPAGLIYLTDPFYKRSWWSHSEMPQEKQSVYLFNPVNKSIVRIAEDIVKPNGIIGTPDGKTLYVADIGDKKTWSFKINSDGTLSGKTLFCNMGSDGMTIDDKGNLFLTGNGVTIFDKSGRQLGNIPVPEKWTANVCFGGKGRKTLFITASESLYSIRMKTKGVY